MLVLQALTSFLLARVPADDERGATAVEYGLMVALIAAVIIFAVTALGDNLVAIFTDVCGDIAAEASAPAACV